MTHFDLCEPDEAQRDYHFHNHDALQRYLGAPAGNTGVEDSAPPINIVSVADFLATELPPREYLLAPILPLQGLVLIHALRGIGKTHLSLGAAYAVACGGTFLRWQAPKARGVLFVDGEMPGPVMQERLAAIAAASDLEPAAPLMIYTPDLQANGMIDLTRSGDQAALEQHLDGIDLIVLDNISTLCRTGKENEAEGWLPVQQWALKMRAQGRSVLFVHHAGKSGEQRGTSRREDVLDTVLALRRPPEYNPADGAVFQVHFGKNRGFFGDDAQPFEARLITDGHGRQQWAIASIEDSTYDRVIRLHQDGLTQQREIAEELNIHKSQVCRHLKKARALGDIKDGQK